MTRSTLRIGVRHQRAVDQRAGNSVPGSRPHLINVYISTSTLTTQEKHQ